MDGSIQRLGRWNRILDRLERVLGLAERALESRAGAEPESALFERASAFRWDARHGAGRLRPIERPQLFDLDDLVCVDRAIDRLVANTEQFLAGLPFNHVLLHGERGTGKSSAVRGLLERYAERGLRIVELHRADLLDLPDVLELSARFGLVIGFYAFDQDAYLEVVKHYAAKARLETPWEELRAEALRWALRRASRSGRSARQFVDDLAGRKALARTR